jgi:hypothetical protein
MAGVFVKLCLRAQHLIDAHRLYAVKHLSDQLAPLFISHDATEVS